MLFRMQVNLTANSSDVPQQEAWSDTDSSSVTKSELPNLQTVNYPDRTRYPTMPGIQNPRLSTRASRNASHLTWRSFPANSSQEESDGEFADDEKPLNFHRQFGIRQSERPTTRYDCDTKALYPLQRNRSNRRSLNTPRKVSFNLRFSDEPPTIIDSGTMDTPPKKVSKSKLTSLWRKLTGASSKPKGPVHSKTTLPASRIEYDGIRVDNEISLIICGEPKVGKSSLIENIAIAVGLSDDGHSLVCKNERLQHPKLTQRSKSNSIVMKWKQNGELYLLKITEVDFSVDEASLLPILAVSDGGILVIAKTNASSMLASINASKLLASYHLPFVFVSNLFGSERLSEKTCLRKLVERMSSACFEMDLSKAENITLKVIESCVQSVLTRRAKIANIWGAEL